MLFESALYHNDTRKTLNNQFVKGFVFSQGTLLGKDKIILLQTTQQKRHNKIAMPMLVK